jgi:hypothetical protein
VKIDKSQPPTDAEMDAVLSQVRKIIADNTPCYVFGMERSQAESVYGEHMYDKADVPSHINVLRLLYIPGCILNCTPFEAIGNCGGISSFEITKVRLPTYLRPFLKSRALVHRPHFLHEFATDQIPRQQDGARDPVHG